MNVTLEYLQKLRIFTKHLINDLLCHQKRISLELDLRTYIYDSKLLLWIGNKNDKIRVDLVNADYSELSAVSTVHMYATNNIQKYKDLDINLDFFNKLIQISTTIFLNSEIKLNENYYIKNDRYGRIVLVHKIKFDKGTLNRCICYINNGYTSYSITYTITIRKDFIIFKGHKLSIESLKDEIFQLSTVCTNNELSILKSLLKMKLSVPINFHIDYMCSCIEDFNFE